MILGSISNLQTPTSMNNEKSRCCGFSDELSKRNEIAESL